MIKVKDNENFNEIDEIKIVDVFESNNEAVFKGSGENLKNYRIYGNTVSGESVGDRTANLFNKNDPSMICPNTNISNPNQWTIYNGDACVFRIPCKSNQTYTLSISSTTPIFRISTTSKENVPEINSNVSATRITNAENVKEYTFTTPGTAKYILFQPGKFDNEMVTNTLMVNEGSTALSYEPYGYRVPVKVEGKNLFDEQYVGLSTTTYYFHINVGDGTFTLSTNAPKNSTDTTNIYLIAGAVSTGASYVNNGVSFNAPKTVTSSNGYVTIAYRIAGGIDPSDYHAMLNFGSEALPYEPYQNPVTTNLYLPEQIRKVNDEAEYIDYKEQKLHKLTQKAPHTATLQLHYGITFDPNEGWNVFDAPEALYYAEDGLAAGTYNFTIQDEIKLESWPYVGTYQFTLTKNVPPGGQLALRPPQGDVNLTLGIKSDFGVPTNIRSYANALSTTPIEEVHAVKGNGGISLGVANGSAQNLNHIGKAVYGSNNYMISTIRQYINSSASTGNMWKPQTKYDRPEFWVSNVNGFMNDIDSTFLNSVGTTKKIVANSNGEYSTFYDKFFLLSQSEVYGGYGNNINEGEPYSYYSNYSDLSEAGEGNDSNRMKKEIGWEDDDPMPWYLRTCSHLDNISYNGPFKIYTVDQEGDLRLFSASLVNSFMIVPACNIALDENYAYNGQVLHVRDQITVTKGNMTLIFDVIDIDHDEVDFYSPNTVDIEIPAITASSNTNILSVNTVVKPSKVWGRISDPINIEYVRDNLGNVLFSKYNEIENELPLNYIEKKEGEFKNYRIYGNTEVIKKNYEGTNTLTYPIHDEEVSNYRIYGQNSRNLFDGVIEQGSITKINGTTVESQYRVRTKEYIQLPPGIYTLSANNNSLYCCVFSYDTVNNTYNKRISPSDSGEILPYSFLLDTEQKIKFVLSKTDFATQNVISCSPADIE